MPNRPIEVRLDSGVLDLLPVTAVDSVQASLQRVLSRWIDVVHEHTGALPSIEHDADWPSLCIVDGPDADGWVRWRPYLRDTPADFSGIERALEEPLHADLRSFYGSYYSDPLPMRSASRRLRCSFTTTVAQRAVVLTPATRSCSQSQLTRSMTLRSVYQPLQARPK